METLIIYTIALLVIIVTTYISVLYVKKIQAHKLKREEYFKLLSKIYAEDPEYVNKLKGIISQFKFN